MRYPEKISIITEEEEKAVDKAAVVKALQAIFENLQQEHKAILQRNFKALQMAINRRSDLLNALQIAHTKLFSCKCESIYTLLDKIDQQNESNLMLLTSSQH